MSNKLVAYFSASGVTKAAAQRLAKITGADIFEIRPAVLYTRADLDWTDKHSRSQRGDERPVLPPRNGRAAAPPRKIDTVFLGFPIWWYVAPHIINTFLESCDFSGKTVIPFATSGGSGMGSTVKVLSAVCPKANWKSGKLVNGMSDKELAKWAASEEE